MPLDIQAILVTSVLSSAISFVGFLIALPTKWGERLLAFHFDKKLKEVESSHHRQIERLKEQLAHFGDRGKRSNEMEFSAIQKIWEAFVHAWLSTNTAAIAMTEIPPFEQMNQNELEGFLSGEKLSDRDKDRLRNAQDKTGVYINIVNWRDIARAGQEIMDARLLLRKQRIFMPSAISNAFDQALDTMTGVFVYRKLNFQDPRTFSGQPNGADVMFLKNNTQMFDYLCGIVNARLFRDETGAGNTG